MALTRHVDAKKDTESIADLLGMLGSTKLADCRIKLLQSPDSVYVYCIYAQCMASEGLLAHASMTDTKVVPNLPLFRMDVARELSHA